MCVYVVPVFNYFYLLSCKFFFKLCVSALRAMKNFVQHVYRANKANKPIKLILKFSLSFLLCVHRSSTRKHKYEIRKYTSDLFPLND